MERGLFWLPLLVLIIGLTWAGWKEYQKVESYRVWAEQFDKAKYDIYAVMGIKDRVVTWGKATAKGVTEAKTFPLDEVQEIKLMLGDRKMDVNSLPEGKTKDTPQLAFVLSEKTVEIPFTEIDMAGKWLEYLSSLL